MARGKKSTKTKSAGNGGIQELLKELWQAAVTLRGSIEPADYKRYVLPLIFLRFLSLRYEKRRAELETLIGDAASDYHGLTHVLEDPDEYRAGGAFVVPEAARWSSIVEKAQADDIKIQLDNILTTLEDAYPDRLRGLLPRIYAGSNMTADHIRGLVSLFSKDIFTFDHGGEDLIGRVYEYFIGEFANSEGKRGGEYFTPVSIVKLLVAMLEPTQGTVFDPCCGSGGMFVQSDLFTKHSGQLSFFGQESKDFTQRLCRMNLFIHGIDGDIQLGNSYTNDLHAGQQFDFVLANPPFNDGAKGENGWGASSIPSDDPRLRIGDEVPPLSLRNANTMWIRHFLYHLKPSGTAGFVMAQGELSDFRGSSPIVRRRLVESGYLDCVVTLTPQLFANTQIPCSLWFLSKNRNGGSGYRARRDEILFVDGKKLGSLILGSRKQKQLSPEEIKLVASSYQTFVHHGRPEEVRGLCRSVPLKEIEEQDYILTPGRYVGSPEDDTEAESFETAAPRLAAELQQLFRSTELLQAELRPYLELLKS